MFKQLFTPLFVFIQLLFFIIPNVFSDSIEEVIVEAERQSGIDVLDEAASLKSFDLEDLETNQIASFGDVANYVPGLTASPTGSQGLRFTIRGIGARDSQLGVETRVGLYIDDAFLGRAVGSFDLVDLENVIVEKGPTGFTGGRNAVGGAISLISAKPNFDEFLGRTNVGKGKYGSWFVNGVFNLPISDNFASRIGVAKSVRDGWVENDGLGEDFWGYDRDSYRVSFLWQAHEDIEVNYSYDLNEAENQPAFFQAIPDTSGGDLGPYTEPGRYGCIFTPTFSCGFADPVVSGPFSNDRQDIVTSSIPIENSTSESSGHSLSLEWGWAEDHTFTFSGTYRKAETLNTFYFYPDLNVEELPDRAIDKPFPLSLGLVNGQLPDLDIIPDAIPPASFPEYIRFCCAGAKASFMTISGLTPSPLSVNTFLNSPPGGDLALRDHEQFSFEFKQQGTLFGGQLDYVAGIYYFNETTGNGQQLPNIPYTDPNYANLDIDHSFYWSDVIELISLVDFDTDIDPDFFATSFISINDIDTHSYAAFTQWNYHPFWDQRLHLTLGLRHTYEKKSLSRMLLRTITLEKLDNNIITEENDWRSFDPEFKVQYDVADGGFVYLRYAEGFRPGNFNVLTRKVSELGFEAEFIDSYELGYKGSLFDEAVTIEFAIFKNEMEDGQSTIRNIFSPLQRSIINTDSMSEGIELNLQLTLTDELSMSLEYAYLRSNNDRFINPFYIDFPEAKSKEMNANPFTSSGEDVSGVTLPLDPNNDADNAVIDRLENACYNDLNGDPLPNISRKVDFETGTCTDRLTNFGSPINSLLVTLEYSKFFNWGELRANLSYSHKDSYFVGSTVDITDRDIVDLRVTGEFEMDKGVGKVALWSQNLFDNEYTINALDVSTIATDAALYGTPRTFGIDFGYEWQ